MMALKVQATRCDHAKQILQWRKRDAGLVSSGEARALAPDDIGLKRGWLSVRIGYNRLTQTSCPAGQVDDVGVVIRHQCRRHHGRSRCRKSTLQQATAATINPVSRDILNKVFGQKGFRRRLELTLLGV